MVASILFGGLLAYNQCLLVLTIAYPEHSGYLMLIAVRGATEVWRISDSPMSEIC